MGGAAYVIAGIQVLQRVAQVGIVVHLDPAGLFGDPSRNAVTFEQAAAQQYQIGRADDRQVLTKQGVDVIVGPYLAVRRAQHVPRCLPGAVERFEIGGPVTVVRQLVDQAPVQLRTGVGDAAENGAPDDDQIEGLASEIHGNKVRR